MVQTQLIYCGDNIQKLRELPDESVDLIYIDPPFNSNRNYEVFWGDTQEKRAFNDRFGAVGDYISWMRPRVMEMYRVLKATGSFYYHCDTHADSYVRVLLDQVFGCNGFNSTIVWQRTNIHNDSKSWSNIADTIYFYNKDKKFTWNPQYTPHSEEYLATKYRHRDSDGRIYRLGDMTSPNPRPNMMYEWKGHQSPTAGWRYSKETMTKLDEEGRISYPSDKSKRPQLKRYLDEMKGSPLSNVWTDIPPLNSQANERLGYPTQKPLALLDRIIKASSNPGDVVLDAFCGCGTALVSAQLNDRKWIGIDISPTSCRVMAQRLVDVCKLREGVDFWVRDLPKTSEQLRAYPPFEFENWAVNALNTVVVNGHAIGNKAKVGDMGIDGRIYPASVEKVKKSGKDLFGPTDVWFPVQVKQKDKVGRPEVDQFETAMRRQGREKGFFVAFGYSSDALKEIDRVLRSGELEIIPITVEEILSEERLIRV